MATIYEQLAKLEGTLKDAAGDDYALDAGDKNRQGGRMTKAQAGRLGGIATLRKYGRNYMQKIGTNGAKTTWTRYRKVAYGMTQYALVRNADDKIMRILDG